LAGLIGRRHAVEFIDTQRSSVMHRDGCAAEQFGHVLDHTHGSSVPTLA
jgi:hypothetical protein